MKMKVLVVICCLFFTQQVFAQAFPMNPTAKQLYELIDDGKVLGTFSIETPEPPYQGSITVVLHPQHGLVTCFQLLNGLSRCTTGAPQGENKVGGDR